MVKIANLQVRKGETIRGKLFRCLSGGLLEGNAKPKQQREEGEWCATKKKRESGNFGNFGGIRISRDERSAAAATPSSVVFPSGSPSTPTPLLR